MKTNQESSERYIPPRVKNVPISTCSPILEDSYNIFGWGSGSSSEGDMGDDDWWKVSNGDTNEGGL